MISLHCNDVVLWSLEEIGRFYTRQEKTPKMFSISGGGGLQPRQPPPAYAPLVIHAVLSFVSDSHTPRTGTRAAVLTAIFQVYLEDTLEVRR